MLGLIMRAATTTLGIEVETNDTDAFKNLFYRTQKKHGLNFSLKTSPTPNHLWIVPRNEKAED